MVMASSVRFEDSGDGGGWFPYNSTVDLQPSHDGGSTKSNDISKKSYKNTFEIVN
ncbi:hypothetical protein Hanom_Chr09g00768631 [Helianthus anomalus]